MPPPTSVWAFPLYLLIMIFLGGGQEELGWRGYILEPMAWLTNLLLGVIWAAWHLPLWFVTIPGFTESYINFGGFILQTTGYSFFLSWVRRSAGERPMACLVAHGWANAFISIFPTVIMKNGVPQTRFWIWVCLILIIGIITMIIRLSGEKQREDPVPAVRTA